MSLLTGCEKPIVQVQLGALRLGLEAHADQVSFFSKPLLTPVTMLFTSCAHGAAHGIGFARIVGRHEAQLAVLG
jgi:hypothetical protein